VKSPLAATAVRVVLATAALTAASERAWTQTPECPDPHPQFGAKEWERTQSNSAGVGTTGTKTPAFRVIICKYAKGVRAVFPDGTAPPGFVDMPEAPKATGVSIATPTNPTGQLCTYYGAYNGVALFKDSNGQPVKESGVATVVLAKGITGAGTTAGDPTLRFIQTQTTTVAFLDPVTAKPIKNTEKTDTTKIDSPAPVPEIPQSPSPTSDTGGMVDVPAAPVDQPAPPNGGKFSVDTAQATLLCLNTYVFVGGAVVGKITWYVQWFRHKEAKGSNPGDPGTWGPIMSNPLAGTPLAPTFTPVEKFEPTEKDGIEKDMEKAVKKLENKEGNQGD
jgi:hypothetical protein